MEKSWTEFLIWHRSLLQSNWILFLYTRSSMFPSRPFVDFSRQFPFSPPRSPNTFATSPSAPSYQPPTRQSYFKHETDLSIVTTRAVARQSILIYLYFVLPSHVSADSFRWPKNRPFITWMTRSASSASAIVICAIPSGWRWREKKLKSN